MPCSSAFLMNTKKLRCSVGAGEEDADGRGRLRRPLPLGWRFALVDDETSQRRATAGDASVPAPTEQHRFYCVSLSGEATSFLIKSTNRLLTGTLLSAVSRICCSSSGLRSREGSQP